MKNVVLEEIVGLCLDLDRRAAEIYYSLASRATRPELARFWKTAAGEEEEHLAFWERLQSYVRGGHIPQIFQYPDKTRNELLDRFSKITQITEKGLPGDRDIAGQFFLAFQLEFYILHPAMEKLWHFHGVVRPGEATPEEEYLSHLEHFTSGVRLYCDESPELLLLGETVVQMWGHLKELTREAEMDVLTRVLNRRGLFNDMKVLAHLARRNSFTAGAMLIDIDHFKVINDRYGHQRGDSVLTKIADIISSQIRRSDVVGRYGGEEFLVFLPQTESDILSDLAEKIRYSVEKGTSTELPATISVGAACTSFPDEIDEGIEALIRAADDCLYEAKAEGRNRVIARPCAG